MERTDNIKRSLRETVMVLLMGVRFSENWE